MPVAVRSEIPNTVRDLAERMGSKKSKRSDPCIRTDFSPQDMVQLGVGFFASILKVLSNEGNLRILREIKEYGKAYASHFNNLRPNLVRLYDHGLVVSPERRDNSLTQLGERVLSFSPRLSHYLKAARRGEENVLLLQLLISRERSFSELKREVGLDIGSVGRCLKKLRSLGFVSKDGSTYRISNEASLRSLKECCVEIIKEYQQMGFYFQNGELRVHSVPEEPTVLPAAYSLKYSALEDVIDDHIVTTYAFESAKSKEELIKLIIYEQTRWKEDTCKPVRSEQTGRLRIAYKIDNISSLQQFVNFFCLHSIRSFDRLSVEEIEVPEGFRKRFDCSRPRYGISGIRNLLGIQDRPLLHVIIPPYLKKRKEVADFVSPLLKAGVDTVGDHQFIGLQLAEFRERVEGVVELIESFSKESPKKALFYPYVEGESFLEKIDIVKEIKCNYLGLGLSPLSFGIPATMFVRKNYSLPLHFHLTLYGIYTRIGQSYYSAKEGFKAGHGVSSHVILKLFCLCGGDEVNVDYYGLYSIDPKEVEIQCEILRWFNVFPALVGGIDLSNLRETILHYGKDIIVRIDGGKFLHVLRQGEIGDFVGAYRNLIENTTKGRLEEDEGIVKWQEKEKTMRDQYLIV
jgi:ribulose 1,5-bisphosphate carboxylase large subunit-like protein/DNA-binding transcriptional ArsR family regulator